MKKLLAALLGAMAIGLLATPVSLYAQPSDPMALVSAWHKAIRDNSPDELAALFTDDAVITLASVGDPVVLDTPEERDAWFDSIKNDDLQVELLGEITVEGDTVTWTERYTEGSVTRIGVDHIDVMITVTVEGDKFKTLRFGVTPDSIEKVNRAIDVTTENPIETKGPMGMPTSDEPLDEGIVGMPKSGKAGSIEYLWLAALSITITVSGLTIRKLSRHTL